MLFARPLLTNTTGQLAFLVVEEFFKEKEDSSYEFANGATDGALEMVSCHCGFIAYLKKSSSHVPAVHCVIHRQHLVAKRLTQSEKSQRVTTTGYGITKNGTSRYQLTMLTKNQNNWIIFVGKTMSKLLANTFYCIYMTKKDDSRTIRMLLSAPLDKEPSLRA
ncbi:hypothetical protein T01_12819 [Trichinella spiralis]|uniref:SCAN domain-containing protein 3 n=1 Tax=Trichinella spiralis TaxID=6334 RepID=A0A0V1BV13_TRISP|nr:hypothetical protein T01_12819 [Trichinella spiralis]